MSWALLLFCLAVVGASLVGGGLPLATVLTHTRLQLYLSFAAGTMLGAVFFHMLPEAVATADPNVLTWTAIGLLALFFLERFFAFHHHEAPADPAEPCPPHPHSHEHGRGHSAGLLDVEAPGQPGLATKASALQWQAAAIGLALHSLTGGVALASGAHSSNPRLLGPAAWGVFLATIIHKPADALTIITLMLRAGAGRRWAQAVNLVFASMVPLGVILFHVGLGLVGPEAGVEVTSGALAFSAGTFLCIALSDLLPELQFHAHDRIKLSLALLGGVGLTAGVATWL